VYFSPLAAPPPGPLSLAGGSAQTSSACRRSALARKRGQQGNRATGQQGQGGGKKLRDEEGRGRWGLPADRVEAGVHPWCCSGSFSSCLRYQGNLSLTLGVHRESQEGGKTRQTGGRCLILRLRAQVGVLPCRLPPAVCPALRCHACMRACVHAMRVPSCVPSCNLKLPPPSCISNSPFQPSLLKPIPSHHNSVSSTGHARIRPSTCAPTAPTSGYPCLHMYCVTRGETEDT
jgi:hypothetical protein